MLFAQLYQKISKNKEMLKKYSDMGRELIRRNGAALPDLVVEATNQCFNNCNFCKKVKGEYLDLNRLQPLIQYVSSLRLTGGEALLHPELTSILNYYANQKKGKGVIAVLTSGLNPKHNTDIYYNNLSNLLKISESIKNVEIEVSYSEGESLNNRIKSFLTAYKNNKKDSSSTLTVKILIREGGSAKNKMNNFQELYSEVFGSPLKESSIRPDAVFETGKEVPQDHICCCLGDYIYVNVKGELTPCMSLPGIYNLQPVIAMIDEPIKIISLKRRVYYGLLSEFQKSNGTGCKSCVTKFPKFVNDKLLELVL